MRNPDGRVDPSGKTWRALQRRNGQNPRETAPKPSAPTVAERGEFRRERRNFVDPRVKENATTKRILDAAFPHFRSTGTKVISGYLNDADLFWKVNYHWEYLLWMVEHCLTLPVSKKHQKALSEVQSSLASVPPDPSSGYRTSAAVGKPTDKTSTESMNARYKTVAQQKRRSLVTL
jgi:hypothetical protein